MTALDWLLPLAGVGTAILLWATRWPRLDRSPSIPVAFTPPTGAALACVMVLLGSMGAAATKTLLGLPTTGADGTPLPPEQQLVINAQVQLGAYLAQSIVLIAYARLAWIAAAHRAPRQRPGLWRSLAIGIAALVLVFPLMSGTARLMELLHTWFTAQPPELLAHETLKLLRESPHDGWFAIAIMLAVVVAPVIEEVLYRGLIQQSIRQASGSRRLAIVATSVLFALVHVPAVPWHALPGLFILSLGFGWAFERTGRLSTSILMHSLFNAANLALALL